MIFHSQLLNPQVMGITPSRHRALAQMGVIDQVKFGVILAHYHHVVISFASSVSTFPLNTQPMPCSPPIRCIIAPFYLLWTFSICHICEFNAWATSTCQTQQKMQCTIIIHMVMGQTTAIFKLHACKYQLC